MYAHYSMSDHWLLNILAENHSEKKYTLHWSTHILTHLNWGKRLWNLIYPHYVQGILVLSVTFYCSSFLTNIDYNLPNWFHDSLMVKICSLKNTVLDVKNSSPWARIFVQSCWRNNLHPVKMLGLIGWQIRDVNAFSRFMVDDMMVVFLLRKILEPLPRPL